MPDYLEVLKAGGQSLVPLEAERATIGRADTNDVVLSEDARASRVHAALELVAGEWLLRDLGSSNGTFLDGARIWDSRPVRSGQEIRIGSTAMFLRREDAQEPRDATLADRDPPRLTERERDVLAALCRSAFSGDPFTEPASVREIAEELVVTDAAVKQHLLRLYEKFGINHEGERRRVRLANEAIRRGAVSVADLRHPRSGEDGP